MEEIATPHPYRKSVNIICYFLFSVCVCVLAHVSCTMLIHRSLCLILPSVVVMWHLWGGWLGREGQSVIGTRCIFLCTKDASPMISVLS